LKTKIKPKKGDIITTEGKKIGQHEGVWYYTIGQRRGIGIGGGIPYFVIEKDIKNNKLIVAKGSWSEELFTDYCLVKEMHWINQIPTKGLERSREKLPLKCAVKNSLSPTRPSMYGFKRKKLL